MVFIAMHSSIMRFSICDFSRRIRYARAIFFLAWLLFLSHEFESRFYFCGLHLRSYLSKKRGKKSIKTRLGWSMIDAVSKIHVRFREIGQCVADLLF